MNTLFERGFALGRAGYAWAKAPPGVDTSAPRSVNAAAQR